MKPNSKHPAADKIDEMAGAGNEDSTSLTRADTMNGNNWSNMFTTFAVGIGVGALIGLLFAPASGKKTRTYISSTVKDGLDDAAATGKKWTRNAREAVEDVKSDVTEAIAAGGKAYRTERDA